MDSEFTLRIDGLGLSVLAGLTDGWIDSIRIVHQIPGPPDQDIQTRYHAVYTQFRNYLEGNPAPFDLPLRMELLTKYQAGLFKALSEVPYGHLISYEELAVKTGGLDYRRAVGMALSRNPFPIVIPCHRVVPKHFSAKKLGGYSEGVDIKRILIRHENPSLKLTE